MSLTNKIGRRGLATAHKAVGYPLGGAPVILGGSAPPGLRLHQGPPWIGGHLRGSRGSNRRLSPRETAAVIIQGDHTRRQCHGRQSRLSHWETVIGQACRRPNGRGRYCSEEIVAVGPTGCARRVNGRVRAAKPSEYSRGPTQQSPPLFTKHGAGIVRRPSDQPSRPALIPRARHGGV